MTVGSVKSVTLYSLPYVVSLASIVAVSQQIASPIRLADVSHTITIRHALLNQTVNRAQKQDRLPINRDVFRSPVQSTSPDIVVDPPTG